jgi:hypothetical protein
MPKTDADAPAVLQEVGLASAAYPAEPDLNVADPHRNHPLPPCCDDQLNPPYDASISADQTSTVTGVLMRVMFHSMKPDNPRSAAATTLLAIKSARKA